MSVVLKIKFGSSLNVRNIRGFVWEKVAGEQGLPSSNFFPYKSRYLNCHQILLTKYPKRPIKEEKAKIEKLILV